MSRGQRVKPGTRDTNRVQRWSRAEGSRRQTIREARREKLRHPRNAAGPQPPGPGKTPVSAPYPVRMRNTSGPARGNWATYARVARESALISKAELARRLKVDRGTIHRWETGSNRPESPDMVAAFAQVLGLDVDEALAAAGLRPGVPAPAEPTRERDEEVELILAAPVDDRMKQRMLERLFELRERDKQRRIEDIKFIIDPRRRDVS